ncbi:MAG: 4Fe-4S binding protein [Candidatus Thorarchaeota archaeon]
MGKHGGLLHPNAPTWVKLYYRRYATSEAEEDPVVVKLPKQMRNVKIKKKAVLLNPRNCNRCGTCVSLCHKHALNVKAERLVIDGELCCGCGYCVKKCPNEVLGLKEERVVIDKNVERMVSVDAATA